MTDTPLPILTAVANPSLEAQLVAAFSRHDLGVVVVRRCVDLTELLSAAAAGTAAAALVSADLRGLDRDALAQLAHSGLVTVGLAEGEPSERLLHQLGARLVLAAGSSPEQVAGAMRAATWERPLTADRDPFGAAADSPGVTGSVIAVWGPTGAPGRTTVALGLADALAQARVQTLLIDADPYGGSVATLTGLLDEAPGITAACRAGNAGTLDVPRLADCCVGVGPGFRVLTGLSQPSRWPELRPTALELVFDLSRRLADVTVIDCGFCLEDDEELSYDTLAPRRNAATLTSLRAADRIVAVGSADPVGLSRLIRELPKLAATLEEPLDDLLAARRVMVVLNRVRDGLLPGDAAGRAVEAIERHAGATPVGMLPIDLPAADAAHGRGELLSETAPKSALSHALGELAKVIHASSEEPVKSPHNRTSGRFRRAKRGALNLR